MATGKIIQADNIEGVSVVKNFVTNPGAQINTTGWVTYADAAGTSPIDGVGGSPDVTITRTTTAPLSDAASFLLSKPASTNVQGQGFSTDFTIDEASKTKVLKIEFDYILSAGTFVAGNPADRTSAGDSDITVWIYDVTNGLIIQPSTYRLYSNSTISPDKFSGVFQAASNSTSYRLILHCGTAGNPVPSWDLKVDNVDVSESQYVSGTPITDWQNQGTITISATTTAPTKGTIATDRVLSRRVGDSLELRYEYRHTSAGSAGSGTYTFAIPGGLKIDSNKITLQGSTGVPVSTVGVGKIADTVTNQTSNQGVITVVPYTDSTLAIHYNNIDGSDNTRGQGFFAGNAGVYQFNDTNLSINFTASVPIQGWSSSVQMSDNADQRIVDFVGYPPSNQALTANTTNINLTSVKDSHGGWTGSTYVIPTAGDYLFSAAAAFTTNSITAMAVYVNSVNTSTIGFSQSTTSSFVSGATIVPNLKAGDIVSFRISASLTLGASTTSMFSISKIQGPASIAATEPISLHATLTTSTSAATGTRDMIFDSKNSAARREFDTFGVYNTSTGVITIPAAGKYEFYCQVRMAGTKTLGATKELILTDTSNNAVKMLDENPWIPSGTTVAVMLKGKATILCNAGDQFKIRFGSSSDSLSITGDSSGIYSYLTIRRTGI